MKKRKWFIIALFIVEAAAIGFFFWKQRDAVRTIQNTPTYVVTEHKAVEIRPPSQKLEDIVRDLTEEEKQALHAGDITPEALAEKLIGSEEGELPEAEPADGSSLEALIARCYLLRERFTMQLEALLQQAKQEYQEKSEAEKEQEQLLAWASEYITQADLLERECDGEMMEIIGEMQELLTQGKGDMGLLDQVIASYANEKEAKKDWYMDEMIKRGLM